MEIHRFEKFWIALSLLLIVGWISTVAYGAIGPGVTMVSDTGGQVADSTNPVADENFREPGVYCNGAGECDVYVVSQQFAFRPNPIRVPAGSNVTFYITSQDVLHGFEVVGTNVNLMVVPGQVAKAEVHFEETGRYGIVCNEYCGSGHHTMAAQLRVVDPANFNATGGSN